MPCSRIALETGTHSPRISPLLRAWGHEVIVAHARKVRLIGESRQKDDRLDAQTLARLARIDPELRRPEASQRTGAGRSDDSRSRRPAASTHGARTRRFRATGRYDSSVKTWSDEQKMDYLQKLIAETTDERFLRIYPGEVEGVRAAKDLC